MPKDVESEHLETDADQLPPVLASFFKAIHMISEAIVPLVELAELAKRIDVVKDLATSKSIDVDPIISALDKVRDAIAPIAELAESVNTVMMKVTEVADRSDSAQVLDVGSDVNRKLS
ncbi:MAG: hypothetical protein HC900_11410 [Methylacidiphilales bacterium]|nr:hypothetical protein [Candidatus Methylacidiphilales bacterium]